MTPSNVEGLETGPQPTAAVFASCEYEFQTGRFTWSDGADVLFGTVPRTVDAFLEHVHADERDRVWNTMWRALSDRGTHDFEYPCIHLEGAERAHAWFGRSLVDAHGRARGLSALVLDVTTRRLTERARLEELAEAQAARERAEGALRGNLALAAVAHDLRTPLTAILGWAKTLSNRRGDPDAVERGVTAILRNARAQMRLLEDVLESERIAQGQLELRREWVSPASLVDEALETFQPEAEEREVYLDGEVAPGLPFVDADPGRLRQVVWNLVGNALKFSPPGATVRLRCGLAGGGVVLDVSDAGPGIPAAAMPHVFEPFWRGEREGQGRGGGLGLGLSIARRLTQLHGGTLQCSSTEGRGATFRVWLPVPEQAGAPCMPEPVAAPPLEGLHVLLAGADDAAGQVLARALGRAGAQVRLVPPDDAPIAAQESAPDVLVTDALATSDPHRGLLAALRKVCGPRLRAVALVDVGRSADRVRARREGYDAEVTRPVDASELVSTLLRVCRPTEA